MRDRVVVTPGWPGEPKYVVKAFIPAETVGAGWLCFQLLEDSLVSGAYQLGWGGQVSRWELRYAEHSLIMDGWVVTLQVWPLDVSGR